MQIPVESANELHMEVLEEQTVSDQQQVVTISLRNWNLVAPSIGQTFSSKNLIIFCSVFMAVDA